MLTNDNTLHITSPYIPWYLTLSASRRSLSPDAVGLVPTNTNTPRHRHRHRQTLRHYFLLNFFLRPHLFLFRRWYLDLDEISEHATSFHVSRRVSSVFVFSHMHRCRLFFIMDVPTSIMADSNRNLKRIFIFNLHAIKNSRTTTASLSSAFAATQFNEQWRRWQRSE